MPTLAAKPRDVRGISRRDLLRYGGVTLAMMTVGRYIKLPPAQAAVVKPVAAVAVPANAAYTAECIQVLECWEAVRKRPGMYVGGVGVNGLHHLVWETLDNAIDEATAGFGKTITVALLADGSCRISDEGRGIPVEPMRKDHPHPYARKSVMEIVFSTLHAGGYSRWNPMPWEEVYRVTGRLHGVGVCCVNFLSEFFTAETAHEGNIHRIAFRRGQIAAPQHIVGPADPPQRTGTTITFKPDPLIFPDCNLRYDIIAPRLRELAYLHRGLTIHLLDERCVEGSGPRSETFHSANGLVDLVETLTSDRRVCSAPFSGTSMDAHGVCEVAMQFCEDSERRFVSFDNDCRTTDGTHLVACRWAIRAARLSAGWCKGFVAVVSVGLRKPLFRDQRREKILNREAIDLAIRAASAAFESWFRDHPDEARRVCARAFSHATIR